MLKPNQVTIYIAGERFPPFRGTESPLTIYDEVTNIGFAMLRPREELALKNGFCLSALVNTTTIAEFTGDPIHQQGMALTCDAPAFELNYNPMGEEMGVKQMDAFAEIVTHLAFKGISSYVVVRHKKRREIALGYNAPVGHKFTNSNIRRYQW
jgi:hypothetical protein